MEVKKVLGKIVEAEFGKIGDYPFLFGVSYRFEYDGFTVHGHDLVNTNSKNCEMELGQMVKRLLNVMEDAKVYEFKDLVNKPVEITMNGMQFGSFRILKEVL